ncbi:BnaA01g26360D [Brassica napus]|uniref:BnaA01g26360D protein n=1 Tax=Brassica napus TaxID=3708 RepID=A0A078FZF6_BRANA|nr:BnaA01g26360D [Brassica napus]
MFPYYVDQTTSNLLAMPTGIITADTLKEINGDGDIQC